MDPFSSISSLQKVNGPPQLLCPSTCLALSRIRRAASFPWSNKSKLHLNGVISQEMVWFPGLFIDCKKNSFLRDKRNNDYMSYRWKMFLKMLINRLLLNQVMNIRKWCCYLDPIERKRYDSRSAALRIVGILSVCILLRCCNNSRFIWKLESQLRHINVFPPTWILLKCILNAALSL